MFQQTVVTVFNADQPADTIRWGETVNQEEIEGETTNSDQQSSMEGEKDMTENHQDDKEESSHDTEHEDTRANAEIVKTINTLPDDHYAWGYLDPTRAYYGGEHNEGQQGRNEFIKWYDMQIHNMAEIKATQFLMGYYGWPTMNANTIQAANPRNETNPDAKQATAGNNDKQGNEESIKANILTQHTQMNEGTEPVNETASTKEEAEGSSSVEPEWGRFKKQNEKEIEADYHTWKGVNVGGHTGQRTTQAYRHGRCYMCSKPVSTTNLDPELELFCQRCGEDLTQLDCGFDDNINPKRGMERRDRDDEEEWGRIPIPQSDDESEGDTWLDESDDSEAERDIRPACVVRVETAFNREPNIKIGKYKINRQTTDDFAFRHGPRRDGTILRKDGSTLDLYDLNTRKTVHMNTLSEEKNMVPDDVPCRPHWTSAILTFQRLQLKMKYKSKTKLRAKIR